MAIKHWQGKMSQTNENDVDAITFVNLYYYSPFMYLNGDDVVYKFANHADVFLNNGNDLFYDFSPIDPNYTTNGAVYGGSGHDTIYGGTSNDVIAGDYTVVGSYGIYSSFHSAIDDGYFGNDFIDGGAGFDSISGGYGNDTIYGGEGDDYLIGDSGGYLGGYDSIYEPGSRADGNDYINGGAGIDIIYGGLGDDTLIGGDGDDVILGNDGFGTAGYSSDNDVIELGAGADTVLAGSGWDSIDLGHLDGAADVVFFVNNSQRDYIGNFEIGIDKVNIQYRGYADWNDLLSHASVYQDSTSAVIEFDDGESFLIFSQFDVANINQNMFIF
jgi:Ca2+-binding RTX toxin-like protein